MVSLGFIQCAGISFPMAWGLLALVNVFVVCNEFVIKPCPDQGNVNCTVCYNHFRPHQQFTVDSTESQHFYQKYKSNIIVLFVLAGWTAIGMISYATVWTCKCLKARKARLVRLRLMQMQLLPLCAKGVTL